MFLSNFSISKPVATVVMVIGLMLVGRMFEESTIYRAAHAFEQAGDWKKM